MTVLFALLGIVFFGLFFLVWLPDVMERLN